MSSLYQLAWLVFKPQSISRHSISDYQASPQIIGLYYDNDFVLGRPRKSFVLDTNIYLERSQGSIEF